MSYLGDLAIKHNLSYDTLLARIHKGQSGENLIRPSSHGPKSPRKLALAQGLKFYVGKICPHDGTRLKYASVGNCACCAKRANKARWAKKKEKQNETLG